MVFLLSAWRRVGVSRRAVYVWADATHANDRASAMLDAASAIARASVRDRGFVMAADALSDVLRAVRLTGAAFFDVVARSPWCAEQPTREQVLPKILPGAEHLISYHVVIEGERYAGRL